MTANNDEQALIRHPSSTPMRAGDGRSGVLQRMTASTLQLMRQFPPSAALSERFTLGDYAFAEPDYRQLLIWAEALGLRPVELVLRLQQQPPYHIFEQTISFKIVDGSIRDLVWDLSALPVADFAWVDGLKIEKLAFRKRCDEDEAVGTTKLAPRLPLLTELWCGSNQLTEIDLSSVPLLKKLLCWDNQLTELNLSSVPELTELDCSGNQLTEIDLSSVPKLTELWCSGNQLTEIDLSSVPLLKTLQCWDNQLTELDLSSVPELTKLWCDENLKNSLDTSFTPFLDVL